jgi:RimJ/RimL family protein N-acetyltransferase
MKLHEIKNESVQIPFDLTSIAKDAVDSTIQLYNKSGFRPPWIGYLAEEEGEIVGTCAFKSSPINKRVEIAYYTFPGNEGKGIATKMGDMLINIARENDASVKVFAQTLPVRNASNSVLQKLGFRFIRSKFHQEDGEVWEWEKR